MFHFVPWISGRTSVGTQRGSGVKIMPLEINSSVLIRNCSEDDKEMNLIEIPVEALPEVIEKLQSFLPKVLSVPELIKKAETGDKEALDTLENLYSTLSHDKTCSSRHYGECDCSKDDIVTVLEDHNREVC